MSGLFSPEKTFIKKIFLISMFCIFNIQLSGYESILPFIFQKQKTFFKKIFQPSKTAKTAKNYNFWNKYRGYFELFRANFFLTTG